ncbi:SAM-dependent methyltransferase [Aquabacterium humicola]|uniref:SAM-dependent methyltransferase n=1 Tax=Aquabacterium humicola TaxID=3237377 RepID=UPI0025436664|nr:cyclopropane-fatty-acyl-phospholipid synthase family protein [Rubrivivax pictus]
MNPSWLLPSLRRAAARPPLAARLLLPMLARLRGGLLDLTLPDGRRECFGSGDGPVARLVVHDWRVFGRVLAAGDIGFADAFIAGEWQSSEPATLLRLLLANRGVLDAAIHGRGPAKLLHGLRALAQRNTRRGSERNIHAHYDIGNAFYREWLDETMSYSSAWFDGDLTRSLADAQRLKMRRALAECGIAPGGRLLEIGCGWGALAELAARETGAEVTGITLSRQQLAWGRERIADAGLAQRCRLQYADYRDLPALAEGRPFDAVISIEMFEAVGAAYWRSYFDVLRRSLKPGGRACIQTITMHEALYDRYVRSTDFIQQTIFPGGRLPSASVFRAEAERAGFEVERTLHFGADYAETLRRWRERFLARSAVLPALGLDQRFERTWHYYLATCEAAFAVGDTDVVQFTLRRA